MKEIISTPDAPAAIGPYSQGIKMGCMIYTSGQIALNPKSGELENGSVEIEARRAMQNLQAILIAADLSFSDVVKTTIFLMDMNDFAKVNEVYASFFTGAYPARETVQVAGLPKGARVEISMIAMEC